MKIKKAEFEQGRGYRWIVVLGKNDAETGALVVAGYTPTTCKQKRLSG